MAATILFLFGPDTYRSTQKVRELKSRYIDASLGDTNLSQLEGAGLDFSTFVRQVQALPFLAKTRLVIIKNLLLEGKKDVFELVPEYLPKIPASTVLVLWETGSPDGRTKTFQTLKKTTKAQEFRELSPIELTRWINDYLTQNNAALPLEITSRLVETVGPDLWRMETELAKLTAFTQGNPASQLSSVDFTQLIEENTASDIFTLLETMLVDPKKALTQLILLIDRGEAPIYLFSMVVYQFRTLLVAVEAYTGGAKSAPELARSAGIPPFVAQKLLRIVPKFSLEEVVAIYRLLLTYDYQMKLGEIDPRVALELVITRSARGAAREKTLQ